MSIHRQDDLHPLVFAARIENLRGHLTLAPKLLSTAGTGPKIAERASNSPRIQSAPSNLKKTPIPDGWRGSGAPRALLEGDPFPGSPSNERRECPPALPPLQGASSHEFIARCSLERRQRAKRARETRKKGFPPRVSDRTRRAFLSAISGRAFIDKKRLMD